MTEHEGVVTEHEPVTYWGWISPRPGLIAGYMEDEQGWMHLYAVLQYPPITAATMRTVSLRQLDNPSSFDGPAWRGPVAPPTPAQLEAAWGEHGIPDTRWQDYMHALQVTEADQGAMLEHLQGEVAERLEDLQGDPTRVLNAYYLTRWPHEPPDAFYHRVSDAYLLLATESATPTKRIADIAGVNQATATSWVHRARIRGHIPPVEAMKESHAND